MITLRCIGIGLGRREDTGTAPYCSPRFSMEAVPVRSRRFTASQDMKFIRTFSASSTRKPPLAL